jgi:UDP-glucose 4-epimerase
MVYSAMMNAMHYSTNSGASSPGHFSSSSDCDSIDTPLTERSLLFDDADIENNIARLAGQEYILVVGG